MGTDSLTARETAAGVRSGALSAVDLAEAALERCRVLDLSTNAFSFIGSSRALEIARAVDERVAAGLDPGLLAGVPVAIKDNICESGSPCTCGSRMLEGYIPSYDAEVVTRLLAAGAVPVARTHMDEFAMGSSTENCAWGAVRNPWDLDRVPGGSSGGSAVAVAGGAVPLAIGSDTGGSVRLPASFTGTVGLKPTYGRTSRRGLVAYASSTDQVSPFARDTADAALIARVLAGHDPADATSLSAVVPNWSEACRQGLHGVRIGLPVESFGDGLAAGVRGAIDRGIDALRAAGAEVVEVSLPSLDLAVACYYVIAPAEASANLARFDGVRYGLRVPAEDLDATYRATRAAGFGHEVKRRILIGTYVLSAGYVDAYYRTAQRVRARLAAELSGLLEQVDALVTPTAPTTAFAIGARTDPLSMYLTDIYTIPASLAGLPAISIPCGLADGLPVGLQITARALDESTCFAVASAVEAALGPAARPPLSVA